MNKFIFVVTFLMVSVFSFGQATLKAEKAKLETVVDSLSSEVDSLKVIGAELDSLKDVLALQVESEIKENGKPSTAWGWILLVVGVLFKYGGFATITTILSKFAKVKTFIGKMITGENSGFIITLIVGGVISLIAEAVIHPSVRSFSFESMLAVYPQITLFAMGIYTFLLKKPLKTLEVKAKA